MSNLNDKDIDEISMLVINDIRHVYGSDDISIIYGLAAGGLDYYAKMQKDNTLSEELISRLKLIDKTMSLESYAAYYDKISPAIKRISKQILYDEFGELASSEDIVKHHHAEAELSRPKDMTAWEFASEQSENISSCIADSSEKIKDKILNTGYDVEKIWSSSLYMLDTIINSKEPDEQKKMLHLLDSLIEEEYIKVISSMHTIMLDAQSEKDYLKKIINNVIQNI